MLMKKSWRTRIATKKFVEDQVDSVSRFIRVGWNR